MMTLVFGIKMLAQEATSRAVGAVADWMARAAREHAGITPSAEILGVHFEGPFISRARRGVHPEEWIVAPSISLFRRLLAAAKGAARILTLAPELPGAAELIAEALQAGLVVSLGHTDASYAEAMAAISCAGITPNTLTFMAM